MAKASRTSGMLSEAKLGSSHLQEIGRVNALTELEPHTTPYAGITGVMVLNHLQRNSSSP